MPITPITGEVLATPLNDNFSFLDSQSAGLNKIGVIVNANGDGVTDNIAEFENAVAELKAKGGGRLFVPAGDFRFSRTLLIDIIGVEIFFTPYKTKFSPTDTFTGTDLIRLENSSGENYTGLQLTGGYIDMLGKPANGLTVVNAYNAGIVRNIEIRNVHDDYKPFNFIHEQATRAIAGQTLVFENTFGDHIGNNPTAPVYFLDSYQEVNFIGTKAFANHYSSDPINGVGNDRQGVCYHFKDCRGVTMQGCSQAFGHTGVLFETTDRKAIGLTVTGATSEGITNNAVHGKDTSGLGLANITVLPIRGQGSVGKILLENTNQSEIHAMDLECEITSGNSNVIYFTKESAYVPPLGNTVVNLANYNDRKYRVNNDFEVRSNANPTTYLGVDGTDYEIRTRYEATSTGNGDIVVQKYLNGAWVDKFRISGSNTTFYDDSGVEIGKFHSSSAAGNVGLSLRTGFNTGLVRLEYGATDSGGTGYRALTIPN